MTRLLRLHLFALLLIGSLFTAGAALAQDDINPDANPTFGGRTVTAGQMAPDPLIITILSGGPVDASTLNLGTGCAGYINGVPDYQLTWEGVSRALRIFYISEGDTTLVVRTPSGKYSCNDDFEDLNPLVLLPNPEVGEYDIWVGSYVQNEYLGGYLMFTEQESSPLNIISPLIGTAGPVGMGESANNPTPSAEQAGSIEGVQSFPGLSNLHVNTRVSYAQTPPVGGEHNPVWLNCGIYDQPVRNENAVHSLEHGAVWITYDPALDPAQVEILREVTRGGTHRLLSPFAGLPAPVVISSWGYQLQLESANDPRLLQFVAQFEQGPTTPELGATCAGGIGSPLP